MEHIKDLSGHSGCVLGLYKENDNNFLRTSSGDKDYNKRLKIGQLAISVSLTNLYFFPNYTDSFEINIRCRFSHILSFSLQRGFLH